MTIVSQICDDLLLNDTLGAEAFAGSRLTINGMKLLSVARDQNGIKLTKSGAFNRKCVEWAAEEFHWPGYTPADLYPVCKVLNEPDVLPLWVMRRLMMTGGLMRKYKDTARLSRAGKDIIANHGALQAVLFETYLTRFDFAGIDWFADFAYDLDYRHVLKVVDDHLHRWTPLPDFSTWCLPNNADAQRGLGPDRDLIFFVSSRVVRPLDWLGLIEEKQTGSRYPILDEVQIRKTTLVDKFLRFVEFRPSTGFKH